MPKYIFYTDSIDTDQLKNVVNAQVKVNAYAINNWQGKNFDQCSYVMNNAKNLSFSTQYNYHNQTVMVKITGELTEQDYIMYRLKY